MSGALIDPEVSPTPIFLQSVTFTFDTAFALLQKPKILKAIAGWGGGWGGGYPGGFNRPGGFYPGGFGGGFGWGRKK
ncbi:hypothetical protein ANCCEY_12085 [Ancylostoma ceylanicum]|nr:hypothetical protein ANCCEY_12085 [Ancylostoma ceylanicum]